MYFLVVAALMFVLPLASIVIETSLRHHAVAAAFLMGKWFVFWAVGIRLLMAGLRQIVQPRYTAETILGITDPDAILIVRELGFANTAFGIIGFGSIFFPGWVLPAGVAGAVFYSLAGINHLMHKKPNKLQNVAMISDLFVAVILSFFCIRTLWFDLG
jgi:uncharacterized protein DUF6790